MCEMVEYASMRLILVWAIAARLPIIMDITARMMSIPCQSASIAPMPSTSKRMTKPNAASLGAEPIKSTTAVGAPS